MKNRAFDYSKYQDWREPGELIPYAKNAKEHTEKQVRMVMGRQDYQWKHEPCLYGWKDGAAHTWNSDRKQTTVIDFDRPSRNDIHPTMKPIGLFDYLIHNSSRKGELVLDTFGGSGTCIMACEQDGRRCFTMELDPRYVDAIIDRWETFTGEKAELLHREEANAG